MVMRGMTCSSPFQMFLSWMVFISATKNPVRMQGVFLRKSVCVSLNDLILKSTLLKIGV